MNYKVSEQESRFDWNADEIENDIDINTDEMQFESHTELFESATNKSICAFAALQNNQFISKGVDARAVSSSVKKEKKCTSRKEMVSRSKIVGAHKKSERRTGNKQYIDQTASRLLKVLAVHIQQQADKAGVDDRVDWSNIDYQTKYGGIPVHLSRFNLSELVGLKSQTKGRYSKQFPYSSDAHNDEELVAMHAPIDLSELYNARKNLWNIVSFSDQPLKNDIKVAIDRWDKFYKKALTCKLLKNENTNENTKDMFPVFSSYAEYMELASRACQSVLAVKKLISSNLHER